MTSHSPPFNTTGYSPEVTNHDHTFYPIQYHRLRGGRWCRRQLGYRPVTRALPSSPHDDSGPWLRGAIAAASVPSVPCLSVRLGSPDDYWPQYVGHPVVSGSPCVPSSSRRGPRPQTRDYGPRHGPTSSRAVMVPSRPQALMSHGSNPRPRLHGPEQTTDPKTPRRRPTPSWSRAATAPEALQLHAPSCSRADHRPEAPRLHRPAWSRADHRLRHHISNSRHGPEETTDLRPRGSSSRQGPEQATDLKHHGSTNRHGPEQAPDPTRTPAFPGRPGPGQTTDEPVLSRLLRACRSQSDHGPPEQTTDPGAPRVHQPSWSRGNHRPEAPRLHQPSWSRAGHRPEASRLHQPSCSSAGHRPHSDTSSSKSSWSRPDHRRSPDVRLLQAGMVSVRPRSSKPHGSRHTVMVPVRPQARLLQAGMVSVRPRSSKPHGSRHTAWSRSDHRPRPLRGSRPPSRPEQTTDPRHGLAVPRGSHPHPRTYTSHRLRLHCSAAAPAPWRTVP